jgi:hypothetical protein
VLNVAAILLVSVARGGNGHVVGIDASLLVRLAVTGW